MYWIMLRNSWRIELGSIPLKYAYKLIAEVVFCGGSEYVDTRSEKDILNVFIMYILAHGSNIVVFSIQLFNSSYIRSTMSEFSVSFSTFFVDFLNKENMMLGMLVMYQYMYREMFFWSTYFWHLDTPKKQSKFNQSNNGG
jgi:hypothetical protein